MTVVAHDPSHAQRPTLRIELDDAQRRYWVGDVIGGVVHLDGHRGLSSTERLVVQLWRFTPVSTSSNDRSVAAAVSIPGPTAEGERSLRFALRCPEMVVSHEGRLFDVGWCLAASVCSAAEILAYADPVVVTVRPPHDAAMRLWSIEDAGGTLTAVVGLVFSLAVSAMVLLIIHSAWGEGVNLLKLLFAGFGVVVVLALVVFSVVSLGAALGIHRLGLSLERSDPRVLVATLRFHAFVPVRGLTVTLLVKESAQREHAKPPVEPGDKPMVHWIVHRQIRHIAVGGTGPKHVKLAFECPDPNVVGWSYDSSDFKRTWLVTVTAFLDGWPNPHPTLTETLDGWRNPTERYWTIHVEPEPPPGSLAGDVGMPWTEPTPRRDHSALP